MRDIIIGVLIVILVVVISLYGVWLFMEWETSNANKLKIGLLDKHSFAASTILPDWINDAWKPTRYEVIYKKSEWGI